MPAKQPFTTSRPSGSKATLSVPLKSSLKPNARTAPAKASGKRKAAPPPEEESESSDAESNATGFSDLEEDEMMGDEMDLDDIEGLEKEKVEEEEEDDDDEMDTEDEIDLAKGGKKKSKKNTKKHKLPTSADTFGATLTSLLSSASEPSLLPASKRPRTTTSTSNPILSLSSKPLPPSSSKVALEAKARRVLKAEKQEREDRARVKDVIEGWSARDGTPGGQDWERGLRKVAQRGVVKLFNAILVASQTNPSNPAALVNNERKSNKEKDNVLGRGGREERLTKEGFLDMIKAGGK